MGFCETKDEQRYIRHIIHDMGLCGCGREDKYELVQMFLERATPEGHADGKWFGDPIGEDLSARAVEFIADVMNSSRWCLLEHGGAVSASWLTDRGAALLQFLRLFGTNAEKWPEWATMVSAGEEW